MRHHASLRRLPRVERLEARDNPGNFLGGLLAAPVIGLLFVDYMATGVAQTFEHHSTPKPPVTYSRKFLLAHGVVLPPTLKPRVAYSRPFLLAHGVVLPHRMALQDMHHRTALQRTALQGKDGPTGHAALQDMHRTVALQGTVLQDMHRTALQDMSTTTEAGSRQFETFASSVHAESGLGKHRNP
jgi:hypothetical protein